MDQRITIGRGETEAHTRLKRLAFVWAQRQGYSACAMEVALPRCRYRVDVAAYRPDGNNQAPLRFSSANRRWSISDATMVARRRRCGALRKFTIAANSWREICACITRLYALPIRSSSNSTRTISLRLSTAATNR